MTNVNNGQNNMQQSDFSDVLMFLGFFAKTH